ncbi:putative (E)-beta-ocimene synthase [Rosa chinensis]|uniref:Putative (E)-beta-ocimene synthase n=1 Tax=Rosa chinensis TaxID=74649 RepID=A0A2P6S2H0_ROSCH|nr:putative (E)-beta-ocimene synthase [Rosa chinensis]
MSLLFCSSSPSFLFTKLTSTRYLRMLAPVLVHVHHTTATKQSSFILSNSSSKIIEPPVAHQRRLAQYHPTIWGPMLIDSFSTHYTHESYASQLEGLKQIVSKALLVSSTKDDACSILKLADLMQRLGVAYHFKKEIQAAIVTLVSSSTASTTTNLQKVSLQFQILRQYGISISSDLFFKDGEESLSNDVEGLLCLYEASHLGMPGEDVLEEAKSFRSKNLKQSLAKLNDENLLKRVEQLLETPVHWRMPRIEALNFINIYQRDDSSNLALLELAELDYNLVQSFPLLYNSSNIKLNEKESNSLEKENPNNITFAYVLQWENLCKSYMIEARWFYSRYTPTLEEYLENAWTSAENERGDVAKSVQCYMEEKGISEEEAHKNIKGLICYSWKKINEDSAKATIPKSIVNLSLNMARTAHCIFQHGDGIGTSVGVTKDRLISLIANPIPIDDDNHVTQ